MALADDIAEAARNAAQRPQDAPEYAGRTLHGRTRPRRSCGALTACLCGWPLDGTIHAAGRTDAAGMVEGGGSRLNAGRHDPQIDFRHFNQRTLNNGKGRKWTQAKRRTK